MKYQIGDFSKIANISIKALRFYHEKSILIPSYIDQESGYRYYSEADLEKARAIRILREFDFSIKEIKEVIEAAEKDDDITEALRQKASEIGEKIKAYRTMERKLKEMINLEEEIKMVNAPQQVIEKQVEDTLVASIRVKVEYAKCGKYISQLYKNCGRYAAGKVFNRYWDKGYMEGDADIEICLPVKKVINTKEIQSQILEGGRAVSIIHKGPYGTQGPAYKATFDYMEQKGLESIQPPREIYLKGPGMIFAGNPKNYLTEIMWIVKEKE